jgi:hypothetical protein
MFVGEKNNIDDWKESLNPDSNNIVLLTMFQGANVDNEI